MKVYTLKILEIGREATYEETIGIFDNLTELFLAVKQHANELELPLWARTMEKIHEIGAETPCDLNDIMKTGEIMDFEINIDYSDQGHCKLPSLNE